MSVLILYSKQFLALKTLAMSLDGMDVILNLATSRNLVFQGISEFNNPSHDSGWNGRDLQIDNFS